MDPKYRLGIPELDEQHEVIENIVFSLQDALADKNPGHMLHYLLEDLSRKLRAHFSFEEAVMRMFAYPKADEHTQAHRALFETIRDYQTRILGNADAGAPPFGLFHEQILIHDTHFADYLRGVQDRAGIL